MENNLRITDFGPQPTRDRTTDDPASSGREREEQGRSVAEPTAAAERSASQGARTINTNGGAPRVAQPRHQRSASQGARTTNTNWGAPRGAQPRDDRSKRQRQTQTGEATEGRETAKRARRAEEGSNTRRADERGRRREGGRRRGLAIRNYGGRRIAMRRPLQFGAGRAKQNYKHVDRSGREHVAWETTTGVLLTSANVARRQGLRPTHVALGGGNPPDKVGEGQGGSGRRQAARAWVVGKYVGRHHLSDDQRKRLRCDATALPDGRPDKEAW